MIQLFFKEKGRVKNIETNMKLGNFQLRIYFCNFSYERNFLYVNRRNALEFGKIIPLIK